MGTVVSQIPDGAKADTMIQCFFFFFLKWFLKLLVGHLQVGL